MTPFDDNDLIDRLQSAIAEQVSGISAPAGISDAARRAARKRTATRVVGAGVPVLAAAGLATVLATSSGSGSTAARGPSAGGSDGSALSAPNAPVKAQDTAYIIRRVKAKVADDVQGGTVVHSYEYASGEDSDGLLVNLGQKIVDGYEYTAADGSVSFRSAFYDQTNGSLDETAINDLTPDGNGTYSDSRTIIDPGSQTYSQDQFPGISDPNADPTPSLLSSPSDVQQALQKGQVTQSGTATVDGTQAIALSVKVPSGSSTVSSASGVRTVSTVSTDLTLYVDAQTYQPLRTVLVLGGLVDLLVADWVPATPENIAQATDDSIPVGYTKVGETH